jgi:hypothetical protein
MKRVLGVGLAAALLTAFARGDASAQASIFLSGGAAFPSGDFSNLTYAKSGWMAQGGVLFPLGNAGLSVGLSGFYGIHSHEPAYNRGRTKLYGAVAFVEYTFGGADVTAPYLFAGPGFLTRSYGTRFIADDPDSGLAGTAGAGVNFPMGPMVGYVEAMYMTGLSDGVDGADVIVASIGLSAPMSLLSPG